MDSSILTDIKRLLGIAEDYTHFDKEITDCINAVLMTLMQLGLGSTEGFLISDNTQTWVDFVGERNDVAAIKTYVFLNTRLLFDPPSNSFLVEAIKDQLKELAWRLNVQAETPVYGA